MSVLSQFLPYLFYGCIIGASYSLIGIGLSVLYGIMGIVNFAHGELFMLGAYFTYFALTIFGFNPIISLSLAGVIMFIFGIIMDKLLFYPVRIKSFERLHNASLMLTLGLSIILQNAALLIFGPDYRSAELMPGVTNVYIPISNSYILSFVISIVLGGAFWFFIRKTKIGKAIRAVSQDKDAAQLMGINVEHVFTLTVGIASLLTGVAGGSLIPIYMAYPTVGATPLNIAFAVVILGGLGSIEGSFFSGFIIGIVEAFTQAYLGSIYQTLVAFVVIIIILMIRPWGLMGERWE